MAARQQGLGIAPLLTAGSRVLPSSVAGGSLCAAESG